MPGKALIFFCFVALFVFILTKIIVVEPIKVKITNKEKKLTLLLEELYLNFPASRPKYDVNVDGKVIADAIDIVGQNLLDTPYVGHAAALIGGGIMEVIGYITKSKQQRVLEGKISMVKEDIHKLKGSISTVYFFAFVFVVIVYNMSVGFVLEL